MMIRYVPADEIPANHIALAGIRIDGGTQSRAGINDTVVAEYAEAMRNEAKFPPMVVFHDGKAYWLADGFHRYHAFSRNGVEHVVADVRQGTQRDAILFSVGANASHGLRRTNEDKHRAIMVLLNDAEWGTWSANQIAKQCGVSHTFVNRLKSSLETNSSERTYITKHGTVATMNTAAIGKPAQQAGYSKDALNSELISETPQTEEVDEDEITEEDLANDPGFQKAVEALNNAKALMDEVNALPPAEPMTPEREAQLKRAFGTQQDRANLMHVIKVTELVRSLPEPVDMVASVPPTLTHAVDVAAIISVSQWFENFARAWERKGAST